jgi:APA family basic amino acid/polyamine antiporter
MSVGESGLLRAVGFVALAGTILNISMGARIFAAPGILAASLGAAAPLAFVLGALLFVPIVLCMAAVAPTERTDPKQGEADPECRARD